MIGLAKKARGGVTSRTHAAVPSLAHQPELLGQFRQAGLRACRHREAKLVIIAAAELQRPAVRGVEPDQFRINRQGIDLQLGADR